MHISLDGYIAGTQGELNWLKLDEELFDFVGTLTAKADAAMYGRVTYDMMQSYWPTAADKPNASKHDREHSEWYKTIPKIVLSRSLDGSSLENTTVLCDDLSARISALKEPEGNHILIFGSPGATRSLLSLGLIDEFWLFVNPIIKGQGMNLYEGLQDTTPLELIETKTFACGIVALHYRILH